MRGASPVGWVHKLERTDFPEEKQTFSYRVQLAKGKFKVMTRLVKVP
jgi:hypothetical protein